MAVKVKQHKGAWWIFIDHHGKRKAKRIGSKQASGGVVLAGDPIVGAKPPPAINTTR